MDYESKIIAFEKELTNKPPCKMDPLELLPLQRLTPRQVLRLPMWLVVMTLILLFLSSALLLG
jgi:hypothetical protein